MKSKRRKTIKRKRRKVSTAPRAGRVVASTRESEVARLRRELHEALEQQTATSEVLSAISSSPGELEPVFDAMLENATRICGAKFGTLYMREGSGLRLVAAHDVPPAFAEAQGRGPIHPAPGTALGGVIRTKQTVHMDDLSATSAYAERDPAVVVAVETGGIRSVVAVPMLKDNELIGIIAIFRQEVRPFADKQVGLLTNFAAQAVIAIENTRLLRELRQRTDDLSESLEQQTATSEVLKVISSSPGELEPVFQAMLENATRICEAKIGILFRYENGAYRAFATLGVTPEYAEYLNRGPIRPGPTTGLGRLAATKQTIHIADTMAEQAYSDREPFRIATAELGRARSLLNVPMLKDNELIGAIGIFREEVRPFTDKQIELVTNFAAQAVIAIENTRLLNELRESLQQQTATSEVLSVISSSPGELEPVFDAMLENAVRICEASFGVLFRFEDDSWRAAAMFGVPPAFAEYWSRGPQRPGPRTALGRIAETRQVVHVADVKTEPAYVEGESIFVAAVDLGGFRTLLNVPMLKDDELIGAFAIYRQEVRAFTDKQATLVTNFAAQAVIAIENTRLLSELRQRTDDLSESLEQQTATSEVLKVISSSPGELEPVFTAMLENAIRICEAEFGTLFRYDGKLAHRVAGVGTPAKFVEFQERRGPFDPDPKGNFARCLRAKMAVNAADELAEPKPGVAAVHGGARSTVHVPMLKDNEPIGIIVIYRQEVRPFTDKQIELVQNFAAQAVIAIENARLLNELRQRTDDLTESLEQQTATSEVLKVISSSAGKLEPVFDAMLENATRICQADFGNLLLGEGDHMFRHVALYGAPGKEYEEQRRRSPMIRLGPITPMGRSVHSKQAVHVLNMIKDVAYLENDPSVRFIADKAHARTVLAVPMLKDGEPIGGILIYRQEIRPFTDKQIELVQSFAAQAVIAIENTRLLSELRQRTGDLTESLEQQTATSEVLKVISSSPGELQPVFQAMLANATRICEAGFGVLYRFDGGAFQPTAWLGVTPALAEHLQKRGAFQPTAGTPLDRLLHERKGEAVQTADAGAEQRPGAPAKLGGARSHVAVPMRKDNELVGAIVIYRVEVRPFSDKQIELVTNFAAQAVIAIENTRLLNELRQRTDDLSESLEQQTATSEVLKVISSSPAELEPVFKAVLANATRLCDAQFASLHLNEGGMFRTAAGHNTPEALNEHQRKRGPFRPRPGTPHHLVLQTKQVVHSADHSAAGTPTAAATIGGAKSHLAVPMLKDNELVGVIVIYRQEVRPFGEKQIELVQSFANQAVIAIENARLLSELRESLQQQTATADVLKTISRSTFDLKVVLNTLVESAARLCEADKAQLLHSKDGGYYSAANYGHTAEFNEHLKTQTFAPGRGSVAGRVLLEGRAVQIPDVLADPEYRATETQRLGGFRTHVGLPLMREGRPIGLILLSRMVVRPFTDKQIELATTFADQAVIAIENVRLFDEIQDKSRQLAEASQHKSQFLANMSHELRTPLNAILGYTELVLDGIYGETPEKAQTVLKRVESNGKHLLGLINDVLDLSKIEAGELKLALDGYSMKDVVHNVFSAVEPLATKKGLGFKVELPPDLPAGHGDERKLTQVVLNLIGNAIKFTDAGAVGIKVAIADGAFVVAVHDTGPGISATDQGKLFEQFQQADNSITKAKGGTGLGLAISRKIIELHGGGIGVESSPGNGSTFTFTLPVTVKQQARTS